MRNEDTALRRRIEAIRAAVGPGVTLVAATKTVPPERINEAIRCGVRVIGENRVQELLEKYDAIDRANVQVHFIGQLQTNKVKYIADKVDMIQSLDSLPLAREIEKRCAALGRTMDCLVEVNLEGEAAKGGVPYDEAEAFVDSLAAFPHIRVRGLMTVPPKCGKLQKLGYFQNLSKFIDIRGKKWIIALWIFCRPACPAIMSRRSPAVPIWCASGARFSAKEHEYKFWRFCAMGVMNRFKDMFKGEDEYDVDGYNDGYDSYDDVADEGGVNESVQAQPQPAARDMRSNGGVLSASALEMKVIKPDRFEAVTQIAEHLLAHKTVVLNLEETNKETIRRIIDFMSGVAFAIEGNIKRVASSTYVITPKNVEVSGEQQAREDGAPAQKELF
ncbi:MAG: YggS family pyridoxal phosphate-dependent enzyme [Acutalibacteraceae bacterium]